MSFLYPRTVAITRPSSTPSVGLQAYGGAVISSELPIASGLPASIQLKKQQGASDDPGLPGNAGRTQWRIFLPGTANGLVNARDIVTDDLGQRYQVTGPYWNSLGHTLLCERLEA